METIHLKRWQQFREYIDGDRQIMPVYWRGQKDPSRPLASSFERKILQMAGGHVPGSSMIYPYDGRYNKTVWQKGFYEKYRDGYLEAFERAASGLRGPNPKKLTRDEWWALGRHYGLATPLLDWTEKPYIAAFFALSELWMDMNTGGQVSFEGKEVAIYPAASAFRSICPM